MNRILIAEDEDRIASFVDKGLTSNGFTTTLVADGESALQYAITGGFDLVILDIGLPGMDGLTAARTIVEKQISPVLILTAFSQRDLVDRAARAGAMAYLVKPFDKAALIPAIQLAIARWDEARALADESKDLAERLETRKLVERAKGALMESQRMTEQEAFRFIQRTAMQERVTMADVARKILGP